MRKVVVALVLGVLATPVAGQNSYVRFTFETPSFLSPRPMDDIGIYLTSGYSDAGLQAIWRQSGNVGLGVRGGIGDIANPGERVIVGGEIYGSLNSLFPKSDIEIAWTLAAGAVLGDNVTVFNIPFGPSVGFTLTSGNLTFTPYVHPRASLDVIAIDNDGQEEDTDSEFAFAVDLGADLHVGDRFILRVGASLGDREAFGVGLAARWPRGVSATR